MRSPLQRGRAERRRSRMTDPFLTTQTLPLPLDGSGVDGLAWTRVHHEAIRLLASPCDARVETEAPHRPRDRTQPDGSQEQLSAKPKAATRRRDRSQG